MCGDDYDEVTMVGDGVGAWVAEVGGIGRCASVVWITEYLFCLPSYNEADLFLGLIEEVMSSLSFFS